MKSFFIKIIFVVILAALLFFVFQWKDSTKPGEDLTEQTEPDAAVVDNNVPLPETVVAQHTFQNNSHQLSGTISLPTPCHELSTGVTVAESFPEQVTIDFVITPPPAGQVCAQVIDEHPFEINFSASPNPIIQARVNGENVTLVTEDLSGTLAPIE